MRRIALLTLLFATSAASAQDACNALTSPGPSSAGVPALAAELDAPALQLGAPSGVLAQAFDQSLTADSVLLRMKIEACRATAMSTKPGTYVPGSDPSTYKPQTAFDNTPWRFDMNQNGKRMTADEFDAWMKSRGVRVAKGALPAAAPAPAPAPAPAQGND